MGVPYFRPRGGETLAYASAENGLPERYKALQHSYAQLEADFHMLANSIPQLAWMTRPDGWIFWYNQRWFDYTGTTLEEMQGWGWRDVHHPDHIDRVVTNISRAFETGEPWEDTFPLKSKDGEYRWFLSRAVPIRDQDGNILRWFGTNTDVTEQKRIEEHQKLLMREIDHRSKNALAVAQAVVNLTRAENVGDYKAAVEGRIASLARTHSLLAASRWEGAEMRSMLQDEVACYDSDGQDRISLDGDPLTIAPADAQSLALIVHELATNAAKHGALSHADGRLNISWHQQDGHIHLIWREAGGSGVEVPQHVGFGSRLLDRLVGDFANGTLTRDWTPEGLHVDIVLGAQGEATAPSAETRQGPRAQKAKPSILVVEDEALTAIDLEIRLQDAGYHVLGPAGSVADARQALLDGRPDLALLDGNLGGERSYVLAGDLMADGVPVVFCTGYEELANLPEGLETCPVVSKPFRDETLFGAIEASLGESAVGVTQ